MILIWVYSLKAAQTASKINKNKKFTEDSSLLIMILNNDDGVVGLIGILDDSLFINRFNREDVEYPDMDMVLVE